MTVLDQQNKKIVLIYTQILDHNKIRLTKRKYFMKWNLKFYAIIIVADFNKLEHLVFDA